MKKILFPIIALSLFTSLHAQKTDRSIRPKPGPAPEIKLGDPETFTLDNGLRVFVVENHKLPTVTYSIQLDIQPAPEGNKAGLKQMVGELIRSGTLTRTKDRFDQEIDQIGGSIYAGSSSIQGYSLTKHQDKLLDLMSDALLHADFQQSELDKLKKQTLSGLESGKNEPESMLENVVGVLNFGKQHPYGEVITEETINQITLEDCKAYYRQYFRPNVAYLAIVGDIKLAEAKTLVQRHFGDWQSAEVARAVYPVVQEPQQAEVAFVPRDGAVQSVIGISYPVSLYPGSSDVVKTKVVNEILGGSSQGRLFLNLREKHGWTYGSYSDIQADPVAGQVLVYAKCRNEVTDSSIKEMIQEMNTMRTTLVAPDILQNALNFMAGKFAMSLENPGIIAQYAINIERYKMPKDYYKNYLKTLSAVTAADVQAVAQQYIHPGQANIVVVGNKSEAEKLKVFGAEGTLRYFDNYGNEIEAVATKAVADSVTAQSVLDKYIQAIGGKKAIEDIRTLVMISSTEMQGTPIRITQRLASPGKFKMAIEAMGMVVQKIVLNQDKGYMEAQGQKQDLTEDQVTVFQRQADMQADLHPEQYGLSYHLLGTEPVDGKEAYVLEELSKDGRKSTRYYDVASGLLVKSINEGEMMGQKMVQINIYGDYREVKNGKGFKVPFSLEQTPPGMKVNIQSAEANVTLKDADFK